MKQLTSTQVHAAKVAELGLDPDALDLTSIEAIAAALRRAASVLCPCTAPTLLRAVTRPLRGLVSDPDALKDQADNTLEAMVAHGDILEHRDIDQEPQADAASLLYAAPPSFVARDSGAVLLLGIAPDQAATLPEELESRVEFVNHIRHLKPAKGETLRSELLQLGLVERSEKNWLKAPPTRPFTQLLAELNAVLNAADPSRDVPGLSLLDSSRPVQYYRGRWVDPKSQSGRFVARRSQAYGADRWCYIDVRAGQPERLIDFPRVGSRWRGCDEAWHLQMAIDAGFGEPQRLKIRPGPPGTRVIQLFSPVPMWARRRWDAIGDPISAPACLFAYRLPESEVEQELRFAREALWLRVDSER